MGNSNLAEQYQEYFEAFKTAIGSFVEIVKAFTATIRKFVDGFKKNITVDEPFSDMDD